MSAAEVTPRPEHPERHRNVHVVVARKANRCAFCPGEVVVGSRIVWYGSAVAHVACDLAARRRARV